MIATIKIIIFFFQFQFGHERKSSSKLVYDILRDSHNISWLKPITFEDEANLSLNSSDLKKQCVCDSTLLGIAFIETAILQNEEALKLLL